MPSLLTFDRELSAVEVDRRLEKAVRDQERAEKLICFYLNEVVRRRLYEPFGFENVYDYALERFGLCHSKTRALLFLARRLTLLPRLTEALAKGKIGWTKAAKAASVATPETDAAWADKAVEHSYRDLERMIRSEAPARGGRLELYVTAEQAATWQRAVELCRRLSGEEASLGLVLEYVAGEFLATYEALAEQRGQHSSPELESEGEAASDDHRAELSEHAIDAASEEQLCPETGLPSPTVRPYADVHREVLERDGWRCQYPGCSVRQALHDHHITPRSRFGGKREDEMHHPSNLVVLCWFHHRMLHAEIIGLAGRAPDGLEWQRPEVMETAAERYEQLTAVEPDGEAERLDAATEPEGEAGGDGSDALPNVWQRETDESQGAPGLYPSPRPEDTEVPWLERLPNVWQRP